MIGGGGYTRKRHKKKNENMRLFSCTGNDGDAQTSYLDKLTDFTDLHDAQTSGPVPDEQTGLEPPDLTHRRS